MIDYFEIGDVVKISTESQPSFIGLESGEILVVRERLGLSSTDNGRCYVLYNGVREFIVYATQITKVVSIV